MAEWIVDFSEVKEIGMGLRKWEQSGTPHKFLALHACDLQGGIQGVRTFPILLLILKKVYRVAFLHTAISRFLPCSDPTNIPKSHNKELRFASKINICSLTTIFYRHLKNLCFPVRCFGFYILPHELNMRKIIIELTWAVIFLCLSHFPTCPFNGGKEGSCLGVLNNYLTSDSSSSKSILLKCC